MGPKSIYRKGNRTVFSPPPERNQPVVIMFGEEPHGGWTVEEPFTIKEKKGLVRKMSDFFIKFQGSVIGVGEGIGTPAQMNWRSKNWRQRKIMLANNKMMCLLVNKTSVMVKASIYDKWSRIMATDTFRYILHTTTRFDGDTPSTLENLHSHSVHITWEWWESYETRRDSEKCN